MVWVGGLVLVLLAFVGLGFGFVCFCLVCSFVAILLFCSSVYKQFCRRQCTTLNVQASRPHCKILAPFSTFQMMACWFISTSISSPSFRAESFALQSAHSTCSDVAYYGIFMSPKDFVYEAACFFLISKGPK